MTCNSIIWVQIFMGYEFVKPPGGTGLKEVNFGQRRGMAVVTCRSIIISGTTRTLHGLRDCQATPPGGNRSQGGKIRIGGRERECSGDLQLCHVDSIFIGYGFWKATWWNRSQRGKI